MAGILLLAGCSTTKHLPEGEILYTGQKKMIVENRSTTPVGETAMEEVEAALATAPNNSLLGSSTIRIPFPMGLWIYNGFVKYEKGFGRWIFNRFAAKPVLMSTVNPDIRQKAAANLLRDYGYFNGTVSYKTFIDPKDSLKAKLQYTVDMRNPYFIDTVYYHGFSERTLRIMNMSRRRSLISPGEQFNVTDLDGERTRISTLLRNVGCYYFRPDYLTYQADTTLVPGGHVVMRMVPAPGMPSVAEKPFYVGKKAFYLYGKQGQTPNDSIDYKGLRIYYHDKLRVRPNMIYRWLNYQAYRQKRQVQDSTGISRRRSMQSLYSLYRQTRVQERLNNVGIFRYLEMQYTPRDTTFVCDTLDVNIHAALDKLYDAELDFNVKMKSNNQTGPGASFTVTKNNVFGGGEAWNVKLDGSYEWQTGKDRSSLMNSYEVGLSTSLMFPRVVFPRFGDKEYDFPATTTFKLYIDQLNRAKYYKLLAFGGNATYDFQPKRRVKSLNLMFFVFRKSLTGLACPAVNCMPAEGNTCRKAAWSRRLSSICFVRMATNLSDCPSNSSNVLRARNCKSISPASIRNLMESRRASAPRLNATGCSKGSGAIPRLYKSSSSTFMFSLPSIYLRSRRRSASDCIFSSSLSLVNRTEATADFNPAFRFTPDRFQRAYCSSSSLASTRAVV